MKFQRITTIILPNSTLGIFQSYLVLSIGRVNQLKLNIGRLYKQYSEFKTSIEDTEHLETRFHLVIDHQIDFKLSSSIIENGKKQTPS